MFDVSFTELLVIGVVALVVIGPERLPKVARTLGHLVGRAQRYVNDVKTDIQREVELDELRKLKDQMQDAAQSVQSSLQNTESSLRKPLEALEQDVSALRQSMTNPDIPEPVTPEIPAPTVTDSASASAQVAAAAPSAQSFAEAEVQAMLVPNPMPTPTQLEIDAMAPASTQQPSQKSIVATTTESKF